MDGDVLIAAIAGIMLGFMLRAYLVRPRKLVVKKASPVQPRTVQQGTGFQGFLSVTERDGEIHSVSIGAREKAAWSQWP